MPSLPETLCYLNGEYLRLCDARVSVFDRGFLFGDGVYEVLPVYGRRVAAGVPAAPRLGNSRCALASRQ